MTIIHFLSLFGLVNFFSLAIYLYILDLRQKKINFKQNKREHLFFIIEEFPFLFLFYCYKE
jgi:hypothetical protein